ncbi:MAG: formylmethanofuran dehydrogenase subunit C [Planctomycetaceae bacterium]
MPLILSLTQPTTIPLEVDDIRLETVRHQTLDQIKATDLQYGNQRRPVGEFFSISGSATDDKQMIWRGDCSRVKLIGCGLTEGSIIVEGNAGMHVGAEMHGGHIVVQGNAQDWVGAEMHGGRIDVHGNAGHLIGAAYRGARQGMTGGEIFIHGSAGNEIGHTMRRGLIAVGGTSGDAVGFGMRAGTILLCGATGIRIGAGMNRGTIVCCDQEHATDMLPTFKWACRYPPIFLRVYFQHLIQQDFPLPEACIDASFDRYSGDFLESGRGEILMRVRES